MVFQISRTPPLRKPSPFNDLPLRPEMMIFSVLVFSVGGECPLGTEMFFIFSVPAVYAYIITHPLKKYKRGGGYAPKLVLFTCFFLGFPREKNYTPRSVRGGGVGRWMWWTKAVRTTSPPSLIHFAEVLEFLGFLGVLNP